MKNKRLRIAVFTDVFLGTTGGIPSSITAQYEALTRLGHKVKVFAPGNIKEAKKMPWAIQNDIMIVPTRKGLRLNGAPVARGPRQIRRFIESELGEFGEQFDLVHVHYEAACSIAGVQLAKQNGLPLVQTMHGREDMAIAVNIPHPFKTVVAWLLDELHGDCLRADQGSRSTKIKRDQYLAPTVARARMWDLMVRQANLADQVITPSQHFADKLKHYGVKRKITVVSNGVSDAVMSERVWPVRKLKTGEPVKIVWYSRLSREKRAMEFLEALRIVRDRGGKFELLVMGDGNLLKAAKRYVRDNRLEKEVKFLNGLKHEEVFKHLENYQLSIINSYGFDTQGLTILEAAVTGLPVIYCDPDMDKIVLPGGGRRAADQSSLAMAEVILDILAHPEEIQRMSEAQLAGRRENLQSTQIKKLLEVYRAVI